MNNHSEIYVELMTMADSFMDESDEILDRATYLKELGKIDDDGYYLMLGESIGLQNKYVELRDQAIDADRLFWAGQYEEDDLRAKDWHEQMIDERP